VTDVGVGRALALLAVAAGDERAETKLDGGGSGGGGKRVIYSRVVSLADLLWWP